MAFGTNPAVTHCIMLLLQHQMYLLHANSNSEIEEKRRNPNSIIFQSLQFANENQSRYAKNFIIREKEQKKKFKILFNIFHTNRRVTSKYQIQSLSQV